MPITVVDGFLETHRGSIFLCSSGYHVMMQRKLRLIFCVKIKELFLAIMLHDEEYKVPQDQIAMAVLESQFLRIAFYKFLRMMQLPPTFDTRHDLL